MANSNRELYALLFGIFVFIAFRNADSGTDTANYIRMFHNINQGGDYPAKLEIGYLFYVRLIKEIFKHEQFLFIFQALLVSYSIGFFIKKYAIRDIFLSVIIFMSMGLLAFHTTGMRQSMAMSFALISFCCLESDKKKSCILFILLSFLFHRSAIIMGAIFAFAFMLPKVSAIHTIIASFLLIIGTPILLPVLAMFDDRWSMYAQVESTGNGYIVFFILLLITVLTETVKQKEQTRQRIWKNLMHFNLIMWSGRLVSRTFERPVLYSFPFILPALINALASLPDIRTRKVCRILSILLFSVFYVYRYHQTPYSLCFF